MEAGRLYVTVGANTKGMVVGLQGADSMVNGFAGRTRARLGRVGAFVGKWAKRGGLAFAGFAALSGKAAIDFEDSMSKIRAAYR